MDGYDRIVGGLDRLSSLWNEENKYGQIDLGATLRRLFGGKSDNQVPVENPEMPSPNQSSNPGYVANPGGSNMPNETTPGYVANPLGTNSNFSVQNPTTTPTDPNQGVPGVDASKYSADNPFLRYIQRNKDSFFVRKPTPELIGALNQWEAQNRKSQQDLLNDQEKLDLERRYKEAQIRNLDAESRYRDRMPTERSGQQSKFVATTLDAYKSDMANKGAYDPRTDTWKTPDGKPPISPIDWVKQNLKPDDYSKFMKEWTGSDYSPPTGVSPKVWQSPVQFNSNQGYDRQVWDSTYSDVQQFGGPGAALNYYLKNKNAASADKIKALLDRYNQSHGTKHTFADYIKKFEKQIAAAPTAPNPGNTMAQR